MAPAYESSPKPTWKLQHAWGSRRFRWRPSSTPARSNVSERTRRVDLLTGRDVTAAVRSTEAEVRREERKKQFDQRVKTIVTHASRIAARYRVDAETEDRDRTHRGQPRDRVESLIVHLAIQDVLKRVPTSMLTANDARNGARHEQIRTDGPGSLENSGPGQYADLPNPGAVIRGTGQYSQVGDLSQAIAGSDPAGESHPEKVGRLTMAEEIVLADLVWNKTPELSADEAVDEWEKPGRWTRSWRGGRPACRTARRG